MKALFTILFIALLLVASGFLFSMEGLAIAATKFGYAYSNGFSTTTQLYMVGFGLFIWFIVVVAGDSA